MALQAGQQEGVLEDMEADQDGPEDVAFADGNVAEDTLGEEAEEETPADPMGKCSELAEQPMPWQSACL